MKKAWATILAVVMMLTMGAMPTFAAVNNPEQLASFSVTILDSGADLGNTDKVKLTISGKARSTSMTITGGAIGATPNADAIATALKAGSTTNITVTSVGPVVTITQANNSAAAADLFAFAPTTATLSVQKNGTGDFNPRPTTGTGAGATIVANSYKPYLPAIDIKVNGVRLRDAMECYTGTDNPIPYVLDKEDMNDADGVRSNTTVYYVMKNASQTGGVDYEDTDFFKLDAKKGNSSKDIASITISTKNFNNETAYQVGVNNSKNATPYNLTGRRTVVAVKLKEKYTDAESKLNFDFNLKITSKGEDKYGPIASNQPTNSKIENAGTFYVKNEVVKADDETIRVGQNGQMIEPVKNEDNTIIWYNNNDDLARIQFRADSDVEKFYSKLSTQWINEDYDAYFDGQDSFIFRFTGSPKISSTSRATLDIYNPFVNDDDEETVDPDEVVIYEIVDGELINRTSDFSYGENDDGYMAFTTKTRTLGTYILCEQEVDEGIDTDDVETPVPEDPSVLPPTTGDKVPPNTGRYA